MFSFFHIQIVHAASTILQALPNLSTAAQPTGVKNAYNIFIVIGLLVKGILLITGIIFLILMVYAGFTWMTAGGEEEKVISARKTIISSLIGVLIIVGAYSLASLAQKLISG